MCIIYKGTKSIAGDVGHVARLPIIVEGGVEWKSPAERPSHHEVGWGSDSHGDLEAHHHHGCHHHKSNSEEACHVDAWFHFVFSAQTNNL